MLVNGLCDSVTVLAPLTGAIPVEATSPMNFILSASVVLLVNNRVFLFGLNDCESLCIVIVWLPTDATRIEVEVNAEDGAIGFNPLYTISSEKARFLSTRVFNNDAFLSLPSITIIERPFSADVSVNSTIPLNTSSWRLYPSL